MVLEGPIETAKGGRQPIVLLSYDVYKPHLLSSQQNKTKGTIVVANISNCS